MQQTFLINECNITLPDPANFSTSPQTRYMFHHKKHTPTKTRPKYGGTVIAISYRYQFTVSYFTTFSILSPPLLY